MVNCQKIVTELYKKCKRIVSELQHLRSLPEGAPRAITVRNGAGACRAITVRNGVGWGPCDYGAERRTEIVVGLAVTDEDNGHGAIMSLRFSMTRWTRTS